MLNENQLKNIEELSQHSLFDNIINHMEQNEVEWKNFIKSNNPEENIPTMKFDTD